MFRNAWNRAFYLVLEGKRTVRKTGGVRRYRVMGRRKNKYIHQTLISDNPLPLMKFHFLRLPSPSNTPNVSPPTEATAMVKSLIM